MSYDIRSRNLTPEPGNSRSHHRAPWVLAADEVTAARSLYLQHLSRAKLQAAPHGLSQTATHTLANRYNNKCSFKSTSYSTCSTTDSLCSCASSLDCLSPLSPDNMCQLNSPTPPPKHPNHCPANRVPTTLRYRYSERRHHPTKYAKVRIGAQ